MKVISQFWVTRRPGSASLLLLVVSIAACTASQERIASASMVVPFDSVARATAIGVATDRMHEHWNRGFSLADVKSAQAAFTPQLYDMLVHDMSDPGGIGYLDSNPFTDAQDDVGPARFEDVRQAGDTLMVRFSREGFQSKRDSITLAMRMIEGTWRIANFIYSAHGECHNDFAVALARYTRKVAQKLPLNEGTCSD